MTSLAIYNKLVLHSSHSAYCILAGLLFIYKQAHEMVSHQQAQLRDNWTQTTTLIQQSFHNLLFSKT